MSGQVTKTGVTLHYFFKVHLLNEVFFAKILNDNAESNQNLTSRDFVILEPILDTI